MSSPRADAEVFEAAAFRRLLAHLDARHDVQNIELMTLAGFCRNCLADWYREAAQAQGVEMDKETAREAIYGMPFAEWKAKYQAEATQEQLAAFERARKLHPEKRRRRGARPGRPWRRGAWPPCGRGRRRRCRRGSGLAAGTGSSGVGPDGTSTCWPWKTSGFGRSWPVPGRGFEADCCTAQSSIHT